MVIPENSSIDEGRKGAYRRKGRQQHGVLAAVFVRAQRFAQTGEGDRRRPPLSVNATSSRKENAATGLVSGKCASQ